MDIKEFELLTLLGWLNSEKLLTGKELKLAAAMGRGDFYFAEQLAMADSLHYHIHVPDTNRLRRQAIGAVGGIVENEKEGYIKYGFPGNIKLIFSHIPVAQKEQSTKCSEQPYLDHIGIDIRSESKEAYIVFQQIPLIAARNDFYFKRQGDGVDAVKCCHMQVREKYWVYAAKHINYEFAFGPLVLHESGFGVDLRPANPFNKPFVEESTPCCGDTVAKTGTKAKIFLN
jgi:hypothetical protein